MCGMMAARKAILRFGRTVKIQAPAGAVADPDCGQYHLCHAYGKEMRRTGAVSRSHILARDCTDTKESARISDSMHVFSWREQETAPDNVRNDKEENQMPKMKTKRAAAKRFKVTGTGKIKRFKAYKRHILTKKSTKRKRDLRQSTILDETNVKNMKKVMPYL